VGCGMLYMCCAACKRPTTTHTNAKATHMHLHTFGVLVVAHDLQAVLCCLAPQRLPLAVDTLKEVADLQGGGSAQRAECARAGSSSSSSSRS
jgi:hypothetical protein